MAWNLVVFVISYGRFFLFPCFLSFANVREPNRAHRVDRRTLLFLLGSKRAERKGLRASFRERAVPAFHRKKLAKGI